MTGEVIRLVPRQGERDSAQVGPCAGLTRRECEVMSLIARGWGNAAICSLLFIAPKTLERHISNLYRKLEVDSNAVHRRVAATLVWLDATGEVPEPVRAAVTA